MTTEQIIAADIIDNLKRYMNHTAPENKPGVKVAILVIAIKYKIESKLV